MNVFYSIITALAGLGVSLYGFNVLRQGMETSLGNGFKRLIGKVSKSPFKSYCLSSGVTGAWQSTTLTLSMITGFLNVGTITLNQAISLMLGVGLGSALAILLLVFQAIDLMKILSILCVIGAFMLIFCKSHKMQKVAYSIMGFGLLFAGISLLSDGMSFLVNDENVYNFLSTITNPFVLFLAGAVLSILTNSMYATVAIITSLVGVSGGGPVDVVLGTYMLLGAIITGGVVPIIYCVANSSRESKAMIIGYNVFKVIATLLLWLLMFLPWMNPLYDFLGHQTALYFVLIYVAISLFVWCLILPFRNAFGKFLLRLVPKRPEKANNIYESFEPDEKVLKVFDLALPWVVANVSRIITMETKLMTKVLNRFSERNYVDRGLSGEIRGVDKIIRLTNNTVVRISSNFNESEREKLNVVLNILSDTNHYLERIKKVLEYGQEFKLKQHRLTKEQFADIQKLWQNISVVDAELKQLVDTTLENNFVVDNQALTKVLAKSKRNESLNSTTRKNIFAKNQKLSGDFGLFFNILLAEENINTDLLNIAIKIGTLSN